MTPAKSLTASVAAVALASAIGMGLAQTTADDAQAVPSDLRVMTPDTPAAIDQTATTPAARSPRAHRG